MRGTDAEEAGESLPQEDRELLEILAAGRSLEEAAEALSYSTRTIKRRLAAVRAALGVRTTAEALIAWRRAREGRAAPAAGPDCSGLTAREREVLELVGEGRSSSAIAASIGVSRATVESQIGSAMRKLGARTRAQAAVLAEEAARNGDAHR